MSRNLQKPYCGECMHFSSGSIPTIGSCALLKREARLANECSISYDNITEKQALAILHHYQKWRRGANCSIPQPYHVGIALDVAIKVLRDRGREK